MRVRRATLKDKTTVLELLDEFRVDCIEQITGNSGQSYTARTGGSRMYDSLLARNDYCIYLLINSDSIAVGIITGYLCPMLRSGEMRVEVEEFFVKKEYRGNNNAYKLMDRFFVWCKSQNVTKINLESDNNLHRAHNFYRKYGFECNAQRFSKKLDGLS